MVFQFADSFYVDFEVGFCYFYATNTRQIDNKNILPLNCNCRRMVDIRSEKIWQFHNIKSKVLENVLFHINCRYQRA